LFRKTKHCFTFAVLYFALVLANIALLASANRYVAMPSQSNTELYLSATKLCYPCLGSAEHHTAAAEQYIAMPSQSNT
jgi:hypothetical protein